MFIVVSHKIGTVTLKSDQFALFVTLTTRAQGRFGDNAFFMLPGTKQGTDDDNNEWQWGW